MNFARTAFGIGFGAMVGMGCRDPETPPMTTEPLCTPSPALIQAGKGLPVARCFSLFEAHREDLRCTSTLPAAPAESYADYFDCLWKDPSKSEEGLSLLETSVLAHLPNPKEARAFIFQRHPALFVSFRMDLAKTEKNPHPEPGLEDLPLDASVIYGAYTYYRRSEEEGVRWMKDGVLEYWKERSQRWIKTADCPKGVIGKCNTYNVAGNDAPDDRIFPLGTDEGTVQVQYMTYYIPDQITLSCEGTHLWSSGCVGEKDRYRKAGQRVSGPIKFDCPSGFVNVHVSPNCEGTFGTAWKYLVTCPK